MIDSAPIWTALSDPKRRQIITLLEEKPRTTSELSTFFDVSRFSIMKHLKVLEQADLIEVKREGRTRWNILHKDWADNLADDKDPVRLMELLDRFSEKKSIPQPSVIFSEPIPIEKTIDFNATRAELFEAFIHQVDAWWGHRKSAVSKVYLEPVINGRFYETHSIGGQGVLYGTVTYIKQDEEIHLECTSELSEQILNYLIPNTVLRFFLEANAETSRLTVRHYVPGLINEQQHKQAVQYWSRMLEQHLKPFVEAGIPCVPYQHNP